MSVWYATREQVKDALDIKETARNNDIVDRAIEAATLNIETLMRRRFYPQVATRYFDWPNFQRARAWRLWLGYDEVLSVSALVSGSTTIASTDYFLEPVNYGPPYSRIEIDLTSSAAFSANSGTHQRSVSVTGVFGFCNTTTPVGALAVAMTDTTGTTASVTDSAAIGVGSLILIGTEYLIVTGKSQLTTGQTVQTTALTALASNESVLVTTGSAFAVGEIITIDSERMKIVDITSNTLTVKRAWDGSTLATHNTGVTIYAPRTLTVTRGAVGSTAATHLIAATIGKHVIPGPINTLCIGDACGIVTKEPSAWSGGAGGGATEAAMAKLPGLPMIRDLAVARYARRGRLWAI